MTLGPILRAKLTKYIQDYELTELNEDEAFELFVNYHILSQQQPMRQLLIMSDEELDNLAP